MTIKPFAIQGADLTLGGVNLQAGTTGVVIPGVTRAASFKIEEVNDTEDQTFSNFPLDSEVVVIDAALYNAIVAEASENTYADFTATTDGEGYIDDIEVNGQGTYTQQQATTASDNDMYAYIGTGSASDRPLVPNDWIQVPFRPKMRANAVELEGGGGADTGYFVFSDNFLSVSSGNQVVIQGESDGNARIDIPDDDWAENNKALTISNRGAQGVEISTGPNNDNTWAFTDAGGLTFPDGSIQTTAYTGQTSSSGELYIMANVDGDIVTSTNGIDWTAPQASGMNGIQRVEIHNGVIVYISGGDMEGAVRGLYYSTELGTVTLCAGTDISTETDNDLFWQQVHYFAGSDKWVAVGYNDGDTNKSPVLAHSDNGITWTVVFVDNTFVTGFNTEDYDWRLTDVAWLDETNQYVITSFLDGPGATGGIFITEDITVALDGTTHVAIDFNARSVVPWSVVGFGGPPGYMILIPSVGGSNNILSGWGTDPEVYDDSFGLWESTFIDELGYAPTLTEVAYKNGDFIGVTDDGQVATIDFIGEPLLIISIPLPYTNTVFSISNANPAVITWGMGNVNQANNEKIVVTLAGEYNGTYYVDTGTRVLYTDLAMTTALDASGFAAFTSGTVTFSHGQYFDAAGASNSYYYIGNDDEQVFRSSNGITWTQQADFTGEYFNDFAYGSFGTASANTGNFTFDEDTITNNNGLILSTNRGTLAIGTNMEVPGVAGHFHIGFDGSNINPPSSDLFLGDDYNYVKLPGYELNPADHGVEIGAHDRDGGDSHVWRFGTDGNITFPDGSIQTTAYTGQSGGVTVSDVWIQTFVTDTPATDVVQVASSVEYDSVGNIIALFNHFDPSDDSTYYSVGKYTSTGTRIWTARFSDDFNTDGWGLAVDSASGFVYIAGQTSSDGGQTNATLTKISGADGTIEWSKLYDFGFDSQSAVVDVASDGNPVMVGYAFNINSRYVATTKVDEADGSIIWSRALDGQDDEQAYGMAVGPSGEIVVVGYMAQLGFVDSVETAVTEPVSNVNWVTNNNVQTNGVNFNVTFSAGVPTITINSDSIGNRSVGQTFATLLGSVFGGTNGIDDMVVKVATLAQPDLDDHMLVVKYDSLGELEWQKAVLFDNNYDSFGADADIDSEGNVYVTGMYEADLGGPSNQLLSIFKLNSSGVKQWSRRIEGNCGAFASSIVVGPDDKLYLSATTFAGTNPGDTDIHSVLAKYEFDGTVAWQRLIDYTDGFALGSFLFGSNSGGSNLAVKQDYVAIGLGFGSDLGGPGDVHAAVAQVSTAGDLFTVGSWDFKQASFSGLLSSDASDIEVLNANKVNTDNASNIDTIAVTPMFDNSNNFLIGTLYSTAVTDDTVGFTILADGSLQASAGVTNTTVLTDTLEAGRPDWLTITPRSPDRDTLDTHYGFDGVAGMWFTGNNEETRLYQPAYPIHTTDSFPADTKVVVEFNIDLVSGQEDWGVCVYPADGVPHWNWDPHPSRIAATIDCDDDGDIVAQPTILGFTNSNSGPNVTAVSKARFTYDPVAELTTLELINSDDEVTSRAELPGRLARGQDYMIGFDADWDEAGPGDKSYFTNLTITSGNTAQVKATELTVTGEIKLPNTVKGFVNMVGPWANSDDDIQFHSVAAHDGYAYMIGEAEWSESNRIRIDKYSLTSGELVWTRILGAGRNAEFDISWTGGTYTLTNIANNGLGYQVGQLLYISADSIVGGVNPTNLVTITVTDVNNEGAIQTATIAGTAPSGTSSQAGLGENNGDGRGDPTSIKYDTVTDTLVVLTAHYTAIGDADDTNWDRALVTRINPVSGDVVSTVTLSDEGDIYPYDVAVHPTTGATAVVGEKRNEYRAFGTLTMLAKGNEYFDILKSNLDAEHYPGSGIPGEYYQDYWIAGTGIANKENVDNVNYYANLTSTTRQGSNAEFNITNNGDGTYSVGITAIVNTNYRVGHKIKVLGSVIGGVDVTNDAIVTVTEITTGNITGVTVTGTAAGSTLTPYNNVTGTNIDVGSGLTVDITVDAVTGSRIANISLGGSNYVTNDVFVIPGTQFANGATPANDVEVTIVGIGEAGGNVTSVVTAGTTPTNAIRVLVAGVDFTGAGSWTMTQNLLGEAFVWTAAWNKAIGGGSNDQFQSVVYSKDGASIYAVGSGSYEVTHRQSLVVKFATSDGTIGFSKYLNSDTVDSYATGVATIGTSDIVVAGFERNTIIGIDRDQQFVARLTSSGTVVWKKFYGDGNWGNSIDNNCDIQVDSDNNIYVTMAEGADNPSFSNRGFHVTKLDQAGNLVWTRCVSGADYSYLTSWNGNRCSSLANDQLVVAGYTYVTDDDYYNGLWASFPTDGFTYFGGEDDFVQQGAFRISQGRIKNGVITLDTGGSFTPSVQAPTITASNNLKKYETRESLDFFEQHLHKMVDPKHGGLVFGDGSRQTFATDKIPQIKADYNYTITAQDSGKHIYYKNNSGTITIPAEDGGLVLPVGFTFTIINRTGSDCFVRLYDTNGPTRGTILGAGRNSSYYEWGIPDSGSGSMVTLIKLESLLISNEGSVIYEPVWMISGPGDIYVTD